MSMKHTRTTLTLALAAALALSGCATLPGNNPPPYRTTAATARCTDSMMTRIPMGSAFSSSTICPSMVRSASGLNRLLEETPSINITMADGSGAG